MEIKMVTIYLRGVSGGLSDPGVGNTYYTGSTEVDPGELLALPRWRGGHVFLWRGRAVDVDRPGGNGLAVDAAQVPGVSFSTAALNGAA